MAGGGQGAASAQAGQQLSQLLSQQNTPVGTAFPPQNFMSYQGQGQPNQPQSPLGMMPPAPQAMGGPDMGADYAPSNTGFDGSGSDAGVGGQPAPMQSPLGSMNNPTQQGNKPLGLAQFQQPQGLQIQGNPTAQVVQRPQR